MKTPDALKTAVAALASIVIDSGCIFPAGIANRDREYEAQNLPVCLGLDALTTIEEIYGSLTFDIGAVCEHRAWFGDYDYDTKFGWGENRGKAITELLEHYL